MNTKEIYKRKLLISGIVAFVITFLSFALYSFVNGVITFGELEEKWDGVSVATTFASGNGTYDNPYVIHNAEEFIYFKNVIEGENYKAYQDKHYVLGANIDFNGFAIEPIGIVNDSVEEETVKEERIFMGILDGAGYALKNFVIENPAEIESVSYFSLFSKTVDASISHLGLDNYRIMPKENVEGVVVLSSLVGISTSPSQKSVFKNIYFNNFNLNASTITHEENSISAVIGTITGGVSIQNIYLNGEIDGNKLDNKGIYYVNTENENTISNVISDVKVINATVESLPEEGISNLYFAKNSHYYLNEEEVELSNILALFNEDIDVAYYWTSSEGHIFIQPYIKREEEPSIDSKSFSFSIQKAAAVTLHDSGVSATDKAVYVNDLTSDYNYYMGLNYASSTNGSIPTAVNKNLYSDSNLAKVYIRYSSYDVNDNSVYGSVSLSEDYRYMYYYKYYPIVNGTVTFDLIDNPWSNRPEGKAFNNWVTDYEGAVVSIDTSTYTRKVTVPASSLISIEFKTSWTVATVVESTDFSGLKSAGMTPYEPLTIYEYGDVSNYYILRIQAQYTNYPTGQYIYNLNGTRIRTTRCSTNGGCPYLIPTGTSVAEEGATYYELTFENNNYNQAASITLISPQVTTIPPFSATDIIAGNFERISVNGGASIEGLYNASGVLQSGTAPNNGYYYKLIQYYNDSSNVNYADASKTYYYLVTRDTNIAYISSNVYGFTNNKPVTVTGIHNGHNSSNYSVQLNNNHAIEAGADLRIEYIQLYTTQYNGGTSAPASTSTNYVFGNFYNVKIGRGINKRTANNRNYFNAVAVIAGQDDGIGTASNPKKYHMIIESGYYNYISAVGTSTANGDRWTDPSTFYLNGKMTYGSDIDRVAEDNDNLQIYYTASGTWGGEIYSGSVTKNFVDTCVKSGTLGMLTSNSASGIYVGGLNGGTIYSPASLTVEGGDILYINGGPLVSSSMSSYNAIHVYFKDGEADLIFGGAARSLTHGNRIISATGGTINYAIFGGSNGYDGNDNEDTYRGTLNGSTYIYTGGNVSVGGGTTPQFNVETGSVFGAGNGRSNSTKIGAVNHSTVIIGENSDIKGNVYGGGNYGAVAHQNQNASSTNIKVLGGTVTGSVYGGGNSNGSGSATVTSTINVSVDGGTVKGSVYGGSRAKGVVYGGTTVTVNGGTVNHDVYGGGEGGYTNNNNPGTYVRDNVAVTVHGGTVDGSVYGGSAYGTVNAENNTSNNSSSTTSVTVNGGVVKQNVFGGGKGGSGYTPRVVGDITVTIDGGSCGKVFGGFDASGKPSAGDVVYLTSGVVGDAFGGGNNANQDSTDIRLQGATVTGNLYGGSNLLGTVTNSQVTVSSGSVTDVYGGNNMDGLTATSHVDYYGGTVGGSVYGGGNQASSTTTNVTVHSGALNDVYGGGYSAGVTNSTHVNVLDGSVDRLFGGSNTSGNVTSSYVVVTDSAASNSITPHVDMNISVVDGGEDPNDADRELFVITPSVQNLTSESFDKWTATLTILDSTLSSGSAFNSSLNSNNGIYTFTEINPSDADAPFVVPANSTISTLGSFTVSVPKAELYLLNYGIRATNALGITTSFNGTYTNGVKDAKGNNGINYVYGGNNLGGTTTTSHVTISDGDVGFVFGGGNQVGVTTTNVAANGGDTETVFGGSNQKGDVATSNVVVGNVVGSTAEIETVYGGNNNGGITTNANVTVHSGDITTVYGGGNRADVNSTVVLIEDAEIDDVYGGGNAAAVSTNTSLTLDGATVNNNIYGGGNEGVVVGNTNVYVTDSHIIGNAFAGGNGSTAVVQGNSVITIDGTTEVGTDTSVAPNEACVFGSGNAASTGLESNNDSVAVVNVVGGTIHGNVYGGPKMAIVYGKTETNIGTAAVSDYMARVQADVAAAQQTPSSDDDDVFVPDVNVNTLKENDLVIHGTVFGGGESNASGSTTYDWTFISVTQGIRVNINGTNYITNNHDFIINGSIFGSGNASSSSGASNIYIKNLGSMDEPNKAISIQRTNYLEIESSVVELYGATDRTNEISDMLYSFNIIDKMVIKNNTTLLLHHNANLLKEFYSGVDVNNTLVPAAVSIDDDLQQVTKNVDNRIYMIPGENLHVAINQAATSYGKVTGMTFFGMFVANDNGTYRFGLYDDDISYGDAGNAGLEIVGGSYVIGLHHANHDITVDGFYSNFMNDDFTEVTTAYIDPTELGTTGYRWIIGFEAINYEFTLIASKYSSLGTYELQLIDFTEGNTTYTVLGFDAAGIASSITLVDSNDVPRVGATEAEANSVLGLSMKAETQEWTSYGTTKFVSSNGGEYSGDEDYLTDSRQKAPSLMFYLYHAKNINLSGPLGSSIITMQAAVPKNAIEFDIKFITITVNITANNDDTDSYDASITYDKKYEMPTSTDVNITNQSQFSTYYSLTTFKNEFKDVYGNNNNYFHVLVTNYALPVNTMITMLDYGTNPNRPEYYYYRITQSVYNDSIQQLNQYNEITYRLSNFIKMDSTSTNNTYSDATSNLLYYDTNTGLVDEEFMFIFDFKECTQVTGDHLNNTMLFELRTSEDRTVFSIYGLRVPLMVYNTYDSSNAVLSQTITDTDSYLYYNIPDDFIYSTEIQYDETENRQSVIDTNYESSRMGLNVVFLDRDGEQVSSSLLLGTSVWIGNQQYFADGDGIFRIKLANKVSNIERLAKIVPSTDLPAGEYTIRYILFASDDGLHNSDVENSVMTPFTVHVVSADNSITVDCEDLVKIVDGHTGLNLKNLAYNTYEVKYSSQLTNPNFRIEIYKRDVSTEDSTQYTSVPFSNLFSDSLTTAHGNEVYFSMGESTTKSFDFNLQSNLTSGTYRIVFRLYDSDQLIDDEIKYVIVKKKIE